MPMVARFKIHPAGCQVKAALLFTGAGMAGSGALERYWRLMFGMLVITAIQLSGLLPYPRL